MNRNRNKINYDTIYNYLESQNFDGPKLYSLLNFDIDSDESQIKYNKFIKKISAKLKLRESIIENIFAKININLNIDTFIDKSQETCVGFTSYEAKLFKLSSGYHAQKSNHLLAITNKYKSEIEYYRLKVILENLHYSRAQRKSNLCSNWESGIQLASYLSPIESAKYGQNKIITEAGHKIIFPFYKNNILKSELKIIGFAFQYFSLPISLSMAKQNIGNKKQLLSKIVKDIESNLKPEKLFSCFLGFGRLSNYLPYKIDYIYSPDCMNEDVNDDDVKDNDGNDIDEMLVQYNEYRIICKRTLISLWVVYQWLDVTETKKMWIISEKAYMKWLSFQQKYNQSRLMKYKSLKKSKPNKIMPQFKLHEHRNVLLLSVILNPYDRFISLIDEEIEALKSMIEYVKKNPKWEEYAHSLDDGITAYADTDLLESIHGVMSRLISLKQNIASDTLEAIGMGMFNKIFYKLKELQNEFEEIFNVIMKEALNMNYNDIYRKYNNRKEKLEELKYDAIVNKVRNTEYQKNIVINHPYNTRSTDDNSSKRKIELNDANSNSKKKRRLK